MTQRSSFVLLSALLCGLGFATSTSMAHDSTFSHVHVTPVAHGNNANHVHTTSLAHSNDSNHQHTTQIVQSDENSETAGNSNRTVAIINGESYNQEQLRKGLQHVLNDPRINFVQVYPMLLEQFIIERLISQTAFAENYADDPRVQADLQRALETIINNYYISDFLDEQITDTMITDAYKVQIETMPDVEEVDASHILVETEAEALSIIGELRQGADFTALAKEKSTGPSGINGGSLGFFGQGQMVPAFEKAAFALEAGEFTPTPVKTEFGYHVILLNERRTKPKPTLVELRDNLHEQLSSNQVQVLVQQLSNSADIERFDLAGNPMSNPQ